MIFSENGDFMQSLFHAERLLPHQAHLAYPLIRLAHPSVTLEQWLGFARRMGRRKSGRAGVVMIRDKRGYIHGLFCFDVDRDYRNRLRMRVRDVVLGRLPGNALTQAIADRAEELAQSLRCDTLLIDISLPSSDLAHLAGLERLPDASFSPATVTFLHRAA